MACVASSGLVLALGPDHLVGVDRGEPEAGSDVLGHDLDLGPEGVVVGLPAALVQTAGEYSEHRP